MSKAACDDLLVIMEGHDSQSKVEALHGMKQSIKKESIETAAVRPLFQSLKLGLANSNSQVSGQALTTTHGALRRLDIQDTNLLKTALPTVLSLLIDRLGDVPDKTTQLSRDCLSLAWKSSQTEVEGAIKQLGFCHRVSKVREQSIRWTARSALDKTSKLNFRTFTSYLITALEDSDGTVREASKQTIIELFLTLPPHARADLRREMSIQNVRKSTMQQIISQLDMPDGPEINLSKSTNSVPEELQPKTNRRIITPNSHAEGSIAGSMTSTYIGSVPGSEMEAMEPATIYSARDLEQELTAMLSCFEGRESEKNWLNREKSLNRLRSILRGNAVRDHNVVLVTGLKALLEGIIKGMTSLRTSLCLIGLQFAKDLFTVLGPGADQFVEQLLGTLVKLTGATKKIQAQAANVTINVLLVSVSYHARLLQHLSLSIQDKNVTPRLYTTSWLRLLLEAHGDCKAQIEHAGIEALDKSIRKGLADANPGVREGMRLTYWKYASIWPDKAHAIHSILDATAKKQLDKANPTSAPPGENNTEPSTRPPHARGLSTSRPAIKTLVQMERARAAQPSIDMIALPKSAPIPAPLEQNRPELKSSLSSGPQRQGLGGAVRPIAQAKKPTTSTRAEDPLRSSVRSTSSQPATNPSNASPLRTEQLFSPRRRKPITEQLESDNWKTRVEGVITLACLLANKEPPNTDGQKISLPSTETLAPILRKLMADSQAEVVDHLMAPEVIAEIAKIIEWDCILPRVLLMAETDESEVGHDVKSDCLPAVKSMFTPASAVHQCLDTLALLKVAGHLGKPIKPNFRFTTAQKRPIIKAVLTWLTELIQEHQNAVDHGQEGNSAFSETAEYKLVMNRTMSMMTNIQPSSMNYAPLATFLKALRKSDEPTFDKNLDTFERSVIIALKKAWGEKPVEETGGMDEPIADVQSVLGAVPVVIPVGAGDLPVNASPETSMEALSLPITPSHNPPIDVSVYGSNSSTANEHEEMTMLPSMFAPKTPAGFRQALHMVDSPWSQNGTPKKSLNGDSHDVDNLKLDQLELGPRKIEKENISIFQDPSKIAGTDTWYRKQMRTHTSTTPLPKSAEDQIKIIDILIARLDQDDLDAPGYRKLNKIVRENPTVHLPGTEGAPDQYDIWQAGAKFDHMLKSLLKSLNTTENDPDAKVQAILLIKNCLDNQRQYFAGYETETIASMFSLRKTANSKSVAEGLEELCLGLIAVVDAKSGIITILQSLQTYVVDDELAWKAERLPSLQLALKALASAVSQLTIKDLEGFAQALSQLIVKALNDEFNGPDVEIAEIRRNTVNLCMAMYSVIGDTRTVLNLLRELKPSQQNLLTYYFANRPSEN